MRIELTDDQTDQVIIATLKQVYTDYYNELDEDGEIDRDEELMSGVKTVLEYYLKYNEIEAFFVRYPL